MTEYKGYRIEPFEPEPGRWRARISRLDGQSLKGTSKNDDFFFGSATAVV